MKKFNLLILSVVICLMTACHDKLWDAIDDLDSRVARLEELCKEMNTNISALQTIVSVLQENDYISGIMPIEKGGEVIGYTIMFGKHDPITIYNGEDGKDGANGTNGIDGKDGYTPILGVAKDTDGVYYWTLDGEWLLDAEGNKLRVTGRDGKDGVDGEDGKDGQDGANGTNGVDGKDGITPQLKIENGYWYISYDKGLTWTELGKAVGEDGKDGQDGKPGADGKDGKDGDSMFTKVTYDEKNVYLTLTDGTVLTIPLGEGVWEEFVSVNNIELSIDDIEAGGWGLYDKIESNTRLRTKELISLSANDTVSWDIPDALVLTITVLKPDGATTDISGALYRELWAKGKGSYVATEKSQLHFIWAKINTNESITVGDWDGTYSINKSNQSNTDNIVDTKIRKIYKFGGKGNDWCFVYLPPKYDKNRQKPYPFVICNHGNGWDMNGTPSTANWTKRTMYVPLTDSDYKSQPTQFNGTSDETLWYSNPTIEKFLSEGYIVCGCQNYADNLYGNDNCRNACAEFYAHMKRTYNVEDRCCMIGASNGAMTTLNTCYLLGENVKAIILQYPLACLTKHYFGYSSHQSQIRKVYGITDSNINEEDFIKATRTHDPMHTNMVDGVKIGYFPPTKIYYSTTDTVTSCNNNALPLYEMLNNSLKVVEITQVDKDGVNRPHGDYAHFNPDEYIEWFNRW